MNNEYSVWLRGDGRFEGRITINGKQVSRYGKTESKVIKKLKKLEENQKAGLVIEKKVRLDDALEKYLTNHKKGFVKPSTYDRLECTFKNQIKNSEIGKMQIALVKSDDISRFLTDLANRLSYSSVKKVYTLLGEIFRYLANTDMISKDPMIQAKMPHKDVFKKQPKDMEVLSKVEIKKVFAVAESLDEDGRPVYRYGEAIILLLLTGLRSGEIRAIMVDDIDFDNHVLKVRQNICHYRDRVNGGVIDEISSTKTVGSVREIPLNDRALLAIKRLLATTYSPESGLLIATSTGKILSNSYFEKCYGYILRKAGVKYMGLHSTRHTFATEAMPVAIQEGRVKDLSEILGHEDVSTTFKFYVKGNSTAKKNLIDKLAIGS